MSYYPWQRMQWDNLWMRMQQDSLPHALLIVAQPGMGKLDFAQAFAREVLCWQTPTAAALLDAGNHPDYFCVDILDGKKIIGVDQIRNLQKQLQQTAHISQYQVVIISTADKMNPAASNALLKTLEEPADNTLMILVAADVEQLSQTIRSRCQRVDFLENYQDTTVEWLQAQLSPGQDARLLLDLAQGAPLTALQFADPELQVLRKQVFKDFAGVLSGQSDPVSIADQWQKHELPPLLAWLQSWLLDMAKFKSGAELQVQNPAYLTAIGKLAEYRELSVLFEQLDKISMLKKQLAEVSQLNVQLLLEDLLIMIGSTVHGREVS